jgi:hypothetical protein
MLHAPRAFAHAHAAAAACCSPYTPPCQQQPTNSKDILEPSVPFALRLQGILISELATGGLPLVVARCFACHAWVHASCFGRATNCFS